MKTVLHVAGARPNFMKVAPIMRAIEGRPAIRQLLVHTGQHYDDAMAHVFFRELGIPEPDHDLGVGSASHAVQTARVMLAFEPICLEAKPDLVMVVGDVNSTMAATLVAARTWKPGCAASTVTCPKS
jgi:UDP-N-acetylglucosamine 2-epimerase (non-hydrolysing)